MNIFEMTSQVHQNQGTPLFQNQVQVNLIITLSLGSTESDSVERELCYNEVAYNSHVIK